MKNYRMFHIGLILLIAVIAVGFAPIGSGDMYSNAAGKVKLSQTKVKGLEGQKLELKVSGTTKAVKWTSSNKKVAKVNKRGFVTLKKKGKCVIKAKAGKKTLKCRVKVRKRKNFVSYDSDVIQEEVADETNYTVSSGTGDTIRVNLPTDPAVQDLNTGDVVLFPSNGETDGLPIKITRKTTSGSNTIITGVTPDPAEVFEEVDIEQIFTADMENFVPDTSVVRNVRPATRGEKRELRKASKAASDEDETKVTIKGARTFDIEKGPITGSFTIGKPKVTPEINLIRNGGSMEVRDFDVNIDFAANASLSASKDIEIDPFYIGAIPSIKLPYGFVGDIIFYIDVDLDGSFTVESSLHIDAGVNYAGSGKPRTYNNSSLKNDLSFEGNLKTLLKTDACVGWGGYWDKKDRERKWTIALAVIGVRAGPAFSLVATYHANKPNECDELSAYLYLDIAVTALKDRQTGKDKLNLVKLLFDEAHLNTDWTLLDNDESNPVRTVVHYEDGVKVRVCTYKSPKRCLKNISMLGQTFKAVSSKYALVGQGGTDSYHIYKDRRSSLEFDFFGSIPGPNIEYWNDRTVGDYDLCCGMHGTAADMLGIDEEMTISWFQKISGMELKPGSEKPRSAPACLSLTNTYDGMYTMIKMPGIDHKCLLFFDGAYDTGMITPDTKIFLEAGRLDSADPTSAYEPVISEYEKMMGRIDAGKEVDPYDLSKYGYKYIYSEIAQYAVGYFGTTYRPQYAIQDINGDGVQELIISLDTDGGFTIGSIFTLNKSGNPVDLIDCSSILNRGGLFLYEDGSIEFNFEYAGGFPTTEFYVLKSNSKELTTTDTFEALANGSYRYNGRTVSEDEYQDLLWEKRNRSVMILHWNKF